VVIDFLRGAPRERQERAVIGAWLKLHAVAMMAATLLSAVLGTAVPVALAAGLSFAVLAYELRLRLAELTPFGGYANQLTAARLVLILCAAALLTHISPLWLLLLLGINVGMDAGDGHLARRYRQVTDFGGVFDREADTIFVLVAYLYYFLTQGIGAWILFPGLLPYFYRLLVWKLRGPGAHEGKQGHAAMLAGANYILLLVALAVPPQHQLRILILSTAVVLTSFSLSFWKLRRDERPVS
jgi:phosphatidylglycerophosphate synthase